ncbi:MAG: hypothetical protein ACR2RL_23655 [Gammaproteobacteria bacterium]
MSEKVTVEPMDRGQKNSPIAGPVEDQSTVLMTAATNTCFWNGQEFSDGDHVECEGEAYECSLGHWVKQD